jgi:hypothetical protein
MRQVDLKTASKKNLQAVLLVYLLLLLSTATNAQYSLDWYTIDGGGGRSSGGPYILTGTIGQPDAAWSSGGNFELLGGFWPGGPICIVQFDDFARLAELWRQKGSGLPADLDGSGIVDFGDVKEFAEVWLKCCPIGWSLK